MAQPILYTIKGHKILFIKNESKNIKVRSVIQTGFINEVKATLGANHLLEHIKINGNPVCKGKCIYYMNKNGISMNASTGLNLVDYFNSGLKTDLNKMIKYICTSTFIKEFSESILIQEKDAVLNELLEYSNDSTQIIWLILFNKFYKYYGLKNFFNHAQQIENLKTINKKILVDFVNQYYKNILFIVSGDFNNNEVLNIFNEYLVEKKDEIVKNKFTDCFSYETGFFFYENKNMQNTLILSAISNNNIKHTIHNNILLTILIQYLRIISMKILREEENLIYGLKIEGSFSYCGLEIFTTINVSNKNASKVFLKFIQILNKCKQDINSEILNGIKKKMTAWYNSKSEDDIINFYENLYIDYIFNNNNDIIVNMEEYMNMYLNINTDELKKIFNDIFDINKLLTIYSSEQIMKFKE